MYAQRALHALHALHASLSDISTTGQRDGTVEPGPDEEATNLRLRHPSGARRYHNAYITEPRRSPSGHDRIHLNSSRHAAAMYRSLGFDREVDIPEYHWAPPVGGVRGPRESSDAYPKRLCSSLYRLFSTGDVRRSTANRSSERRRCVYESSGAPTRGARHRGVLGGRLLQSQRYVSKRVLPICNTR